MIKIKTRKTVEDGELYREILGVEALGDEDLPQEYLDSWERWVMVFEDGDLNLWKKDEGIEEVIFPGMWILESYFQRLLKLVKKAGTHLQEINEDLKRKKWKGKETIMI